ncbi:hypothetical protein HC928_11815 [bacterium]|nr:hypothetical protein [bacterium]
MANEPLQEDYSTIIDLIFKNAQQSVKELDDSSNILNTKLSAVTGFSIILIKFVGDLPDQSLMINTPSTGPSIYCYSCLIFKILSLFLLVTSTLISLRALLPKKGNDQIISPAEQVEKCLDLSADEYKLLFIEQYDRDIESLVELRDWKARRLNWSGEALVASAVFSALDILLANFLTFFT